MRKPVEQPRIGEGVGWFIAALVSFAIGIFCVMAASGGSMGAAGLATICFAIGSGCLAVGFWTRLAHLIELRLIDIQKEFREPEADTSKPSSSHALEM
jgi:hypothetical protein